MIYSFISSNFFVISELLVYKTCSKTKSCGISLALVFVPTWVHSYYCCCNLRKFTIRQKQVLVCVLV
jgi:hypothetical protein